MKKEIKVLLVEDDEAQRRLMSMLLKTMEEVRLTVAADGLQGLERAQRDRPDVILLDLILPGISGIELLRRYRRGGGQAGVLAISKAVGEEICAAAIGAGANFFLCKPVQWPEVRQAVRSLAGGLTRRCEELLAEMGGPDLIGRRQAARCAGWLGGRESGSVLLKEAYLEIAKEERTSVECVEKNIRQLIKELAETGTPLFWNLLGGKTDKPPTNKRFLFTLAEAARRREE